jgi:transcriptional regulator with XRE-family HTH domain
MAGILEAIRREIKASGLSRYAISKETGIDQAQLSRLMNGKFGLRIDTLEILADFLGLEILIRPKRKKGRTDGKHKSR